MARFTGFGSLTVPGDDVLVAGFEFANTEDTITGVLITSGSKATIERCVFSGGGETAINSSGDQATIKDCRITFYDDYGITIGGDEAVIEGCYINGAFASFASGAGILLNAGQRHRVVHNTLAVADGVAAIEADGDEQTIAHNTISVDGVPAILVVGGTGTVDHNTILGNDNADGIVINSTALVVEGNYIANVVDGITFTSTASTNVKLAGNLIHQPTGHGIHCDNGSSEIDMVDNTVVFPGATGITFETTTATDLTIDGNKIEGAGEHGIALDDVTESDVHGNRITEAGQNTADTYDGIILVADCDGVTIDHNKIRSTSGRTRYGVNVAAASCDDNAYVGNRARGSFGTGAYNNAGTSTTTTWPGAAAPQGDNLT